MTSPAASIGIYRSFEKTDENTSSDGFGSNFGGAAFCLAQLIRGLLVKNRNGSLHYTLDIRIKHVLAVDIVLEIC